MQRKYVVKLTLNERAALEKIIRDPKTKTKRAIKAKILLKLNEGKEGCGWDNKKVADAFDISEKTIFRMRQQFLEEGYESVLIRRPYPKGLRRKFDGENEAKLVALCCGTPPEGHAKWSLRLLSDKVVELEIVESISPETIRKTLKKMNLSLG